MRLAYVGLSMALALFIIAQAVNRPVLFYTLVIPVIVLIYGILAEETLPIIKVEDTGESDDEDDD